MTPDESPPATKGQPGILAAALYGLCPACGARTLFAEAAQVARQCTACGLEFHRYERGARLATPAAFMVAALVITAALTLDAYVQLPLLLVIMVWGGAAIGGVIFALRLYKTVLLYARYERLKE